MAQFKKYSSLNTAGSTFFCKISLNRMALNKKRPEYPYLKQRILDAFNRGIFYPETSPLVCSSNSYLRQYFFSVASVLSMGGSPGLVVMGGRIVGLNPGTVYWMDMTFFTLICCKNCNNVCLKIPKINEKETRVGPLKSVLSKNAPTLVALIGITNSHVPSPDPTQCRLPTYLYTYRCVYWPYRK